MVDSDVSHEVEKRLSRIEEHLGIDPNEPDEPVEPDQLPGVEPDTDQEGV